MQSTSPPPAAVLPALAAAVLALAGGACSSSGGRAGGAAPRPGTQFLEPPSTDVGVGWPVVDTNRFPRVSRRAIMAMADAYVNHAWSAGPENIFHGVDRDGIRVDTPDSGFRPANTDTTYPGWWSTRGENTGIPYQWGGYSTLAEFDAGVEAGKYAGDVSSPLKRRLLDAAVSRHAVGIDCSGLISRCWQLPRSYSTRELPGLCLRVANWDDLEPGDILNTRNEHVMLFGGWTDETRMGIIAYEAGSPPDWKVVRHGLKRLPLLRYGYQAYRYKNAVD